VQINSHQFKSIQINESTNQIKQSNQIKPNQLTTINQIMLKHKVNQPTKQTSQSDNQNQINTNKRRFTQPIE
jgi:hypothetical protein